jgi:hypothetical protein
MTARLCFEAVCERELEGVVAKRGDSPYRPGGRGWIKIKNRDDWRYEIERESAINKRRKRAVRLNRSSRHTVWIPHEDGSNDRFGNCCRTAAVLPVVDAGVVVVGLGCFVIPINISGRAAKGPLPQSCRSVSAPLGESFQSGRIRNGAEVVLRGELPQGLGRNAASLEAAA